MIEYTVVYLESFMCGSHRNTLTKIQHITVDDSKTLEEELKDLNIYYDVVYVFEGTHSPLESWSE